jgi:hypothetical protein
MLIIVPSRNRPENASRLLRQIQRTIPAGADLHVMFAVDQDDLSSVNYPLHNTLVVQGGTMVNALNEVATLKASEYEFLGFLGDDTLPHGDWYARIVAELEQKDNAIVYANDLINGALLPTAAFMDANIIRTLGFMAPPAQKHLYVDNFWKELGQTLGTLTYLDDVIIEHLHPHGGKAASDEIYEAAYTAGRWSHDQTAFEAYMETNFINDIKRFK